MRRLVAVAAVLATCALAAPAGGQSGSSFFFFGFGEGVKIVAQWDGPVHARGAVTITYHGDAAAGCATRGVCDTSGTIVWTPSSPGSAAVLELRRHRRVEWSGAVTLGGGFDQPSGTVVTHRVRSDGSDATCLDAAPGLDFLDVGDGATTIPIGLTGGLFGLAPAIAGRCAGPTAADVGRALTRLRVAPATLRHGTTLRFAGDRPFTAAGFAGRVTSTLALRLGRMQRERQDPSAGVPKIPGIKLVKHTLRSVFVHYRVMAVHGSLIEDVRGTTSGACALLDSCDTTSVETVTPSTAGSFADLEASSESASGFSALRRTLGLLGGPGKRSGRAGGIVALRRAALDESLKRGDGSTCSDHRSALELDVSLGLTAAGLTARATDSNGVLRTRCPGPVVSDATLLTGTVPRSALGHRELTLRLDHPRDLSDDGWTGRAGGALVLRLRRGRVHQSKSVYTAPDF